MLLDLLELGVAAAKLTFAAARDDELRPAVGAAVALPGFDLGHLVPLRLQAGQPACLVLVYRSPRAPAARFAPLEALSFARG